MTSNILIWIHPELRKEEIEERAIKKSIKKLGPKR